MNIRKKLTVIMTALVTVAIFATGATTYIRSRSVIMEQTTQSALSTIELEGNIISGLLKEEQITPIYLSVLPEVRDLIKDPGNTAKINAVTELFQKYVNSNPQVESVALVNKNGIIAGNTDPKMIGADVSTRTYHEKSVTLGKSYISETMTSK